ncbi:unnamed protein product [Lactuca virosa]|uniref:Uncharacterized protein n=1 Tax=Lactuca virosa TaxID=75947 RepID=A0AAU9NP84_9ASTR|nr:unnamed protein product [Lactuca virosa]
MVKGIGDEASLKWRQSPESDDEPNPLMKVSKPSIHNGMRSVHSEIKSLEAKC